MICLRSLICKQGMYDTRLICDIVRERIRRSGEKNLQRIRIVRIGGFGPHTDIVSFRILLWANVSERQIMTII